MPIILAAFEDKLCVRGLQTAQRLTNFFTLLLLAAVIVAYGLVADSTAGVIVVPLVGPIMVAADTIVMGLTLYALRSLALMAVGVTVVILASLALFWNVPEVAISFIRNTQLSSRIAPGLLSLLIHWLPALRARSSRCVKRALTASPH